MTLQEAENYFDDQIDYLKKMSLDGSPWIFLCGSAVIEYLSKLAAGKDDGGNGYKTFVTNYMPDAFRNFKYKGGQMDLPEQMYHVLRCGIVHSFSLIPNELAIRYGGRNRSIALTHNEPHLTQYSSQKTADACRLRANSFVADIDAARMRLFTQARSDLQIEKNIIGWLNKHPPIAAD
jgi:hypothetical protein